MAETEFKGSYKDRPIKQTQLCWCYKIKTLISHCLFEPRGKTMKQQ